MVKKVLMVALLGFALGFGCGGDDDGDDPTADFTGVLIDFGSKVELQGMTVTVLNNTTGVPLAGFAAVTTPAGGAVSFSGLPVGKVGFKVDAKAGTPGFVDTYQFNLDSDGTGETLWAVDAQTYQLAPAAAGITLEAGKAVVAGGFYWVKPDGTECPLCGGTMKAFTGGVESGEIRYFSDAGMPTTLANQSSVNEANGFALAANVTPGSVVTKGYDPDGAEIGSAAFTCFADSITISNIRVEGASNPGDCTSAECQ